MPTMSDNDEAELNVDQFVSQVEDIQKTPAGVVSETNGTIFKKYDVPSGFELKAWAQNAWPNNNIRMIELKNGQKAIVDNNYQTKIEYVLIYKGLV